MEHLTLLQTACGFGQLKLRCVRCRPITNFRRRYRSSQAPEAQASPPISSLDDADIAVRSFGVDSGGNLPGQQREKVAVMLLNLGGPDTLEDVQPFLYNLFADPDIIRLPPAFRFLQPSIAKLISTLRAPKSTEAYKTIGGGSPLRRITEDQAEALQTSLRGKGIDAFVYVAMRYWHPYTEEAIEQLKADGVRKLVILPLYPQFSISTSGSSLRLLEDMFKTDIDLAGLEHTVIPSWYQRKGYVTAMADLIQAELPKFPADQPVRSCFSLHTSL